MEAWSRRKKMKRVENGNIKVNIDDYSDENGSNNV